MARGEGCPSVDRLLDCRFDGCSDLRTVPIVLGSVLYARRSVMLEAGDDAEAKFNAELKVFAARNPKSRVTRLEGDVAARIGFSGRSVVQVENEDRVPVAFQPAFVPLAVFKEHRGGGASGPDQLIGIERWVPYEANNPEHSAIVLRLLSLDSP